MKKLLPLAVSALCVGSFAADLTKDLLFEADYRTGKPEAVIAKGDKKPSRYFNSPIVIEKDGLVTGPKSATLRYSAAKNINPAEGTIELYVKNVDYRLGDGKSHGVFSCGGPNANLNIYFGLDNVGANFKVGKAIYHPRKKLADLEPESQFRHLVAVYSADYYAFYVDGELAAERRAAAGAAPFDLSGAKMFFVGNSFNPWRNNGTTQIGFVRIYNRVLDESEIMDLAEKAKK